MNFKNYLESIELSNTTIERYHTKTLNFITWLDKDNTETENTTTKEVLAYLQHLKRKGLQNKSRNINLVAIKHYFSWQIQQEVRNDNPAKHIKLQGLQAKKLQDIFTVIELEKLYNNYKLPNKNDKRNNRNWWQSHVLTSKRNKVTLSLFIYQGLTTAEVTNLTVKDLKLREGTITIQNTKKSKERTLKLQAHQILDLMEYTLQVRQLLLTLKRPKCSPFGKYKGEETNQLFISKGNKTNTNDTFKRFAETLRKQNTKFINFRQIRASVITHWLSKYNLREVQYMAGHKRISSTEAYLVNRLEDLQSDIDKYHPRN